MPRQDRTGRSRIGCRGLAEALRAWRISGRVVLAMAAKSPSALSVVTSKAWNGLIVGWLCGQLPN
jgi:hypothetical protein